MMSRDDTDLGSNSRVVARLIGQSQPPALWRVPQEILGRAGSSGSFMATALQPLAPLAFALLLTDLHQRTMYVIAALTALITSMCGARPASPTAPPTASRARPMTTTRTDEPTPQPWLGLA
jgi:hypothetical protein